jgi:hypothetical protein
MHPRIAAGLQLPVLLIVSAAALTAATPATLPAPELQAAAIRQWQQEITALEARNPQESHPPESILFIGSSSVRLWNTITTDIAPYHPIQRGYGGAKFSDLAVFAQRLISPHRFHALVLFAANDVTGGSQDATPEHVAGWFAHIIKVAQATQPHALIFCLEITPTPARWAAWPKIREVNRALARECAARQNVHFIPTAHAYLDADGQPLPDLFVEDRLHQNPLGYRIWSALIKSHLDAHLLHPTADPHGFISIFNGRDLVGWEGKPGWWTVEDGAITSQSTPDKPCDTAHYLLWRGGQPSNFDLRLEFRLVGGNSGIQFRSRELPNWDTSGYQADIEDGEQWTGCLFEHARGGVAMRGEQVLIAPDGTRTVAPLGNAAELLKSVKPHDWNSYRILAHGPYITLEINGAVMTRAIDHHETLAARKGVIALQMHPGPPMKVQFRNLRIKPLEPAN